ncbi:MAG: hypothetical protein LBB98_08735 [Treponema sp.]|jgi:hypothetical protein|nr:hypothetical protein [Treponema sp.]
MSATGRRSGGVYAVRYDGLAGYVPIADVDFSYAVPENLDGLEFVQAVRGYEGGWNLKIPSIRVILHILPVSGTL